MARAWYIYNNAGSLVVPSSYLYTPTRPGCRSGFNVCAIYAIYGGAFPTIISSNLRKYMANGLMDGVPEPQLPPGAIQYVYMVFH
ncbi:hypothetical protein TH53_12585 [Pedobacter lusitanus]|uniref:Uncharacterized protein n=1 Tax=Pedobacter lusitanus TaxID=1503925 RepID=A0A0D0F5J2_9SPHI|nr:hypothetical protein [Pedobacter lusitanus]KIO76838.1 hypothetical protein TH53_12585 [Pedobacter lusitanus]